MQDWAAASDMASHLQYTGYLNNVPSVCLGGRGSSKGLGQLCNNETSLRKKTQPLSHKADSNLKSQWYIPVGLHGVEIATPNSTSNIRAVPFRDSS